MKYIIIYYHLFLYVVFGFFPQALYAESDIFACFKGAMESQDCSRAYSMLTVNLQKAWPYADFCRCVETISSTIKNGATTNIFKTTTLNGGTYSLYLCESSLLTIKLYAIREKDADQVARIILYYKGWSQSMPTDLKCKATSFFSALYKHKYSDVISHLSRTEAAIWDEQDIQLLPAGHPDLSSTTLIYDEGLSRIVMVNGNYYYIMVYRSVKNKGHRLYCSVLMTGEGVESFKLLMSNDKVTKYRNVE